MQILRRFTLPALLLAVTAAACGDDDATPRDDRDTAPTDTADASSSDTSGDDTAGDDTAGDAPPPGDTGEDASPGDTSPGDASADTLPEDTTGDDTADTTGDVEPDTDGSGAFVEPGCDALDPVQCSFPWPSNLYLREDLTRATGHTLWFGPDSLPANKNRRHMRASLFRHLDGYGLGTPVMTVLPGVDITDLPQEESIGRSVEADSPSLLLRVDDQGNTTRVPHFVELDARETDDATRILFLRPAVILEPAARYLVVLRGLEDADGERLPSSDAFVALRDGLPSTDPDIERRRARFDEIFAILDDAGIERESLTLAWDFVTASEDALHGRLDSVIDTGLEAIPEDGPAFALDRQRVYVPEPDGSGSPVDDNVAWRLDTKMTAPWFLRVRTGTTVELNIEEQGLIAQNGEKDVVVNMIVPHRALAGEPAGVVVYGHGLLGSGEEIYFGHLRRMAGQYNYILVSTPMVGMSEDDLIGVLGATLDMSNFTTLSDGLVQGIFLHHALARAGKTSLEPFLQTLDPDIDIDEDRVFYFGGSQGGIFGTTIAATSPDMNRSVLAVPGNNYSTMLQRSVNFDPFFERLTESYQSYLHVVTLVAAAQLLWDTTDPVSYWKRLLQGEASLAADRRTLALLSKADYQVAVVTNEIAARTYPELRVMAPWDTRVPWGITTTDYPHAGSGMILFDFGNPWPIGRANTPPSDGLTDPHPRIAEVDEAGDALFHFLENGEIIDVCGGDGCTPR